MARETHWSDLKIGIFGAAGVAVLALLILLFARVGSLPGKKATLYVVAGDATGVLKGTPIWLAGQQIGVVTELRFEPVSVDTSRRILIVTSVVAKRLPLIRRDSKAEIKPGTSMIGIPVVFLNAGSSKSPAVREGDTLYVAPATKMAKLGDSVTAVIAEVSGLSKEVRKLVTNVNSTRGSLGAMRKGGLAPMADVQGRMSALATRASSGNGSLAQAMRGNLGARISSALAGVDSIKTLVASDRGSLGRFRRDSTLPRTIAGMMTKIDSLMGLLSDPVGAIAKAHTDSALVRALARSNASLDSLMKDAKKHPLRYISF